MPIRAVVIEDLDDEERTVAVSVADGKVRLLLQKDDENTADNVDTVLDIRDLMSSITFLDQADQAPDLEEHIRQSLERRDPPELIHDSGIQLGPNQPVGGPFPPGAMGIG